MPPPSAEDDVSFPVARSASVKRVEAASAEDDANIPRARATSAKRGSITDHLFDVVDRDQNGVITRDEFRTALSGGVIRKNSVDLSHADVPALLAPTGCQRGFHAGFQVGVVGRQASLSSLVMDFSKRRASC